MAVIIGLNVTDVPPVLYSSAVVPVLANGRQAVDYAAGAAAGYVTGYSVGQAAGQADGKALGRRLSDDEAEEAFAIGVASGTFSGLALGRRRDEDDLQDEAFSDGRGRGISAGLAIGAAIGASSGGDSTPPALGTVSPDANEAPGSPGALPALYTDAKDVPFVIPVVDASSAVAFVVITAQYSDRSGCEAVYVGAPSVDGVGGYKPGYAGFSALSGSGAAGVGFIFSIRNDGGWPAQNGIVTTATMDTRAVDAKGNVL